MAHETSDGKTSAETLVSDTAASFHTYIGKGVNVPGLETAEHEPSLNVEGITSLLRIHFILTGSGEPFDGEQESPTVTQFVKGLPKLIRRMQRSTNRVPELVSGGVDGKIDWGETVEMYSRRGFVDRTKFVCTQQRTEYDTPQNQILKRLLLKIRSVFENELQPAVSNPDGYDWLAEWLDNPNLLGTVNETLSQNVYLQSVNPPEHISQRTLRTVKQSRRPLYRQAAKLLEEYYSLQNRTITEAKARQILRNVYIRPDTEKGGTLFELYWIFSLLQQFPDVRLRPIPAGTNLITEWSAGDDHFQLFHHSTGPGNLTFSVRTPDVANELALLARQTSSMNYFQRIHAVQRDSTSYARDALGTESQPTLWSGVPDILLIRTDPEGKITGLLIGEVKYTRNIDYIKTGIKELLEYTYYAKCGDDYLVTPTTTPTTFDTPDIEVEGVVFVDRLPPEYDDTDLPISLVEYGDSYIPFATE